MAEKSSFLEIGKIINTHGVRGEVKVEPWSDSPDTFRTVKTVRTETGETFSVLSRRTHAGHFVLLTLAGIDSVEAAIRLKNRVISAPREEIRKAPGSHFICDLVGLPVTDADTGKVYGTLSDIEAGVAQELYVVKTPSGAEVRIPNVPVFVKEIDEERGIFITPIPGFFGEEDA